MTTVTVLPENYYALRVIKTEIRESKRDSQKYISLTLEVTNGVWKGHKVFLSLAPWPKSRWKWLKDLSAFFTQDQIELLGFNEPTIDRVVLMAIKDLLFDKVVPALISVHGLHGREYNNVQPFKEKAQ